MKTLDKVNEYFCIVDVVKQKILLYTKDKKSKTVFSLKKAKLEESKENDFRVIIDAGRSSENYLTF